MTVIDKLPQKCKANPTHNKALSRNIYRYAIRVFFALKESEPSQFLKKNKVAIRIGNIEMKILPILIPLKLHQEGIEKRRVRLKGDRVNLSNGYEDLPVSGNVYVEG